MTLYRIAATLSFILASNGVLALDANEEITPSDIGYQYLVYAVTWLPSFCKLKPDTAGCDRPPAKFITHGIWPYNNSTDQKTNRHPAFCNSAASCKQETGCEIDDDTLDRIAQRPEIAELVTASPQGMFRHEWKKHGTCSGKPVQNYFSDIVKLRKVVDYNELAFHQWIGRHVNFDVLKAAFPPNTSFRCFTQDGKQYLHEVFYPIYPDGTRYEEDADLQIGTPCKSQDTFIPEGV